MKNEKNINNENFKDWKTLGKAVTYWKRRKLVV